jgi:GNAT superfamily N-acetyltransferase
VAEIPRFALETLEQVRASGIEQLLERHWQEVAFYKDVPLEPDWELYQVTESIGRLRIFTARIAGEFVGYAAFLLNRNAHYKSSWQAAQDVIFVVPEHRNGRLGAHLVLFAERHLRLETPPVQVVYQHSKASSELDIGPLLKRLGYELVDTIWAKRLDRS